MNKRKMSYATARMILESEQVALQVGQQYNIVTPIEDIDVANGTYVIITDLTDDKVTFKVVDTELEFTTDIAAFTEHTQLATANVNEHLGGPRPNTGDDYDKKLHEETAKKWNALSNYERMSLLSSMRYDDYAEKKEAASKGFNSLPKHVQEDVKKRIKYDSIEKLKQMYARHSKTDEAFSPADAVRVSAVMNSVYAMVNYAHALHINAIDAPNVYAVHKALEDLYEELPACADSLGEALQFDFDVTVDSSVVINEANPVKAMFDLRNDLLSIQDSLPKYAGACIDNINMLLTSTMYKMCKLGGMAKPEIAIVNESKDWSKLSDKEKLDMLKLAIMSDGLSYEAQEYVSKTLDEMPDELKASLEVLLECDESEAQDAYREFFHKKLEEFGVDSPAKLSDDKKKEFFNQIKAEWPDAKEEMLNEGLSQNDIFDIALTMLEYHGQAAVDDIDNFVNKHFSKEDAKALEDAGYDEIYKKLDANGKKAFENMLVNMFKKDIQQLSKDNNLIGMERDVMKLAKKLKMVNESANIDNANKAEFCKAYAACSDLKTLNKIEALLQKNNVKDSTAIDIAYASLPKDAQKEANSILGAAWMNESAEPQFNRKRSIMLALDYVNESMQQGDTFQLKSDLTATDGTVIPAMTMITFTGIDSNTNIATIAVENTSYAVTAIDLAAATSQL